MSEVNEKVYKFGSLSSYSFKEKLLIRAADLAFYFLIRVIGSTIRFEVEGWENFEAIGRAGKIPIYAFWHDRIFAGTYFFRNRGIVVITSRSLDGEYMARFIKRLGYGAVRGSSTRGGVGALVEMIRRMRSGMPMAFSVDGPRGPRYQAKNGAVLLAKKSGNPLMPFVLECEKYWVVRKSWDRLQIPRPFTRVRLMIATPIYVPENADEEAVNQAQNELQTSLDKLVVQGRNWRENAARDSKSQNR